MTLWCFQKASRHISNTWDTSWNYFAMLVHHYQTEEIHTPLLQHYQLSGSFYSPWTAGSLTTHHRRDERLERIQRILQNYDSSCACPASFNVLFPPARALRRSWRGNCGTPSRIISRNSLRTNSSSYKNGTKTNHAASFCYSEVSMYLQFGHQGLWPPVWLRFPKELSEWPDKPKEYWSRSLNDAECVYDTMHKECFAVVWDCVTTKA